MHKMTVNIPLKDDDFRVSGWCGNRPQCVKVAIKPQGVAIRDSKDPMKTTLTFTNREAGKKRPASDFELVPPRGTKVIQGEPGGEKP